MGYRSEVKYVIKDATNTGKFKDYISYLILKNDNNINEALNELKISPDFNYIIYESDWIKWYLDYEDIIAHINIYTFNFNYFDNEDSKSIFNSMFIRIGEDDKDIEIESHNSIDRYSNINSFDSNLSSESSSELYEILNVSRHINLNYNHKLIEFKHLGDVDQNEN